MKSLLSNDKLILLLIFSISSVMGKMAQEDFYKADKSIYTSEYCAQIRSYEFLDAVKQDPARDSQKPAAFRALFDGCRGLFLYDALMAKNIIIPMVDSENTEYLPMLLDYNGQKVKESIVDGKTGKLVDVEKFRALDMSPEIENILKHLFAPNLSTLEWEKPFFFQVRNPDRALAYLLAYTSVTRENLDDIRTVLEGVKNHPRSTEYVDAKAIASAVRIVEKYMKSPEMLGNHVPLLDKNAPPATPLRDYDKFDNDKDEKGSLWPALSLILGLGSILAAILAMLWKFREPSHTKLPTETE